MIERLNNATKIAADVAAIASAPGRIGQRAQSLLQPLREVVPYRGAWISLLNQESREQPPLVCEGYPDGMREYMSGPAGVAEVESAGLNRSRLATRLSDLPVELNEMPSWEDYLAPAGFRGGLATGLFTTDGRFLGVLGLTTDTVAHPTSAACHLISELTTTIADALDPTRSLAAAVRIVRAAEAAIVLTQAGNPLPLPGLPTDELLSPGSPVLLAAAEQLADGTMYATFLTPHLDSHTRITVLACSPDFPGYLKAVVAISPAGDLRGLTRRELVILGLLIDNWPAQRIATTLELPLLTVAEDIDSAQAKLRAPNRILITMRALRTGLYVPGSLSQATR
jgi:DNA-binding CsgD family transcriptional regulator